MRFLLDTHTQLWALFDEDKLSKKAKAAIKNPENSIFVSVVSYWEISLKYALGKIELQGVTPDELPKLASGIGLETLAISAEDASSFYRLPRLKHKDPFDRLIIWQAINRAIPLISKDRSTREYQKHGLETIWG